MVIPIDALQDAGEFPLATGWREQPASEPLSVSDPCEPGGAMRGILFGLLMSAVLWMGLIAGGRALLALLR